MQTNTPSPQPEGLTTHSWLSQRTCVCVCMCNDEQTHFCQYRDNAYNPLTQEMPVQPNKSTHTPQKNPHLHFATHVCSIAGTVTKDAKKLAVSTIHVLVQSQTSGTTTTDPLHLQHTCVRENNWTDPRMHLASVDTKVTYLPSHPHNTTVTKLPPFVQHPC